MLQSLEVIDPNLAPGLLPHEARFVLYALTHAKEASRQADLEYGEAVENSGGDWAFDDPGSAVAAAEARQRELEVKMLERLAHAAKYIPLLNYPPADSTQIYVGSRVSLKMGRFEDQYDIASYRIPGMEAPDDIEIISVHSPLGQGVLGATLGDTVSWMGSDKRQFSAQVTGLDQLAQQAYYLPIAIALE